MRKPFSSAHFPPAACSLLLLLAVSLVLSSCKSKPVPVSAPELPLPSLVFEKVDADDPAHLNLSYTLEAKNPFPLAVQVKLVSWRVELNGRKAGAGFNLEDGEALDFTIKEAAGGGGPSSVSISVRLSMDLDALAAEGLAPADDYKANLILELNFSPDAEAAKLVENVKSKKSSRKKSAAEAGEFNYDSIPSVTLEVSGPAAFPGVRPPEFSITAIAILKAELINTRFRVGLKIDNPNPYPVELSAFAYELFGNGRLWADGAEKNIIKVPGKSSVRGNLFLIMNFINMKRDLLDQIIRLEDVNYRFAGEVQVSTGVEYLPKFKTGFDLSGFSQVLEN